jgi:hypothetical protein
MASRHTARRVREVTGAMGVFRRVVPIVVLVTALGVALRTLVLMAGRHGVMATRALAVTFMLCDVAISTSLIMLLVIGDRRAPRWLERRLPYRGRWLWHLLLSLTILAYVCLAPTFMFLLLRLR